MESGCLLTGVVRRFQIGDGLLSFSSECCSVDRVLADTITWQDWLDGKRWEEDFFIEYDGSEFRVAVIVRSGRFSRHSIAFVELKDKQLLIVLTNVRASLPKEKLCNLSIEWIFTYSQIDNEFSNVFEDWFESIAKKRFDYLYFHHSQLIPLGFLQLEWIESNDPKWPYFP